MKKQIIFLSFLLLPFLSMSVSEFDYTLMKLTIKLSFYGSIATLSGISLVNNDICNLFHDCTVTTTLTPCIVSCLGLVVGLKKMGESLFQFIQLPKLKAQEKEDSITLVKDVL